MKHSKMNKINNSNFKNFLTKLKNNHKLLLKHNDEYIKSLSIQNILNLCAVRCRKYISYQDFESNPPKEVLKRVKKAFCF